jgi:hypothetical protein
MKRNVYFKFQLPAIFVCLVFHKSDPIKSCSSFEGPSGCEISPFRFNWCKFYIHLRNLNVRYIDIVEATELKIVTSRSPSMT